jgi:hypothetical protein
MFDIGLARIRLVAVSDPLDRSAKLKFTAGKIEYQCGSFEWSVPASEVRLIGEYTNANGPWLDDYFLVFLALANGAWNEASFYASGRDAVLAELGRLLGTKLELGLCNSTTFKSRVIWPLNLAGADFVELVPARTRFGRFRQRWMGAGYEIRVTESARLAFQ